jgi:hypothetical protein
MSRSSHHSAPKGPLNNLDLNGSHVILNRHHDGSIYPVLLDLNEQVNVENKQGTRAWFSRMAGEDARHISRVLLS